jgi:tetratricopeptide (TPR) repeat protein
MAANCYVALRSTGWVADFGPFVPKVVELVAQAPEVGRDDAFTLGSTGFAAANILNDLDAGATLLDRALALNANFAQVWVQSAYVRAWLGEPELALAHTERARRLSPVDPQTFTIDGAAALAHFLAGRNEEALSVAEMALRQNPFFSPATRIALASAALLNRTELAKKYLAQLRMLDPTLSMSNLAGRIGVRRPEHIARFTEGLRKAGLPE